MSREVGNANGSATAGTASRTLDSDTVRSATDGRPTFEPDQPGLNLPDLGEAEAILLDLAKVFSTSVGQSPATPKQEAGGEHTSNLEAKYRALLEQIPAVVFMAYLDRGISEAYVSPQIEAALGYSREEWLEDPVRWYQRIHPDDKQRWSLEAAEMFLSGKPLRSAYRVIARDGRIIWFHCDAKMMRHPNGRPWFIHGVAFDISDLKRVEEELQEETETRRRSRSAANARHARRSSAVRSGKSESISDSLIPEAR